MLPDSSTPRSLAALLDRLRCTDVSDLIPRLHPNAGERIRTGSLAVSEFVLIALWLGVSPMEIWREPRLREPRNECPSGHLS